MEIKIVGLADHPDNPPEPNPLKTPSGYWACHTDRGSRENREEALNNLISFVKNPHNINYNLKQAFEKCLFGLSNRLDKNNMQIPMVMCEFFAYLIEESENGKGFGWQNKKITTKKEIAHELRSVGFLLERWLLTDYG